MTKKPRKKHTASFKTKVVLEALNERSTLQELANKYELHPQQITTWKKEFIENAEKAFDPIDTEKEELKKREDELFRQIGQMKVQIDW
jgi:transposase